MESRKPKILIVDDVELNRSFLKDMLGEDYYIIEASNGVEAIDMLKQYNDQLAVVLLDAVMPEMDGFEVLSLMNRYHWIDYIPVIMISAENSASFVQSGYEFGAVDYIGRPFDINIVKRRVQNTIMLYSKQKILQNIVTEQIAEKEKNNTLMVDILSTIVEFRNGESGTHVLRIRIITELLLEVLARKCREYKLTASEIAIISNASSLHDVGKIAIPEDILNKPGRLTDTEFAIMKTHAAKGADMIGNVYVRQADSMIQYAHDICRWHHERWDGGGYPDGLKENQIPISAQAVSIADVYDALVSERCYKPAYTPKVAIEMIKSGLCGVFNPELLECFLQVADNLEEQIKLRSNRQFQLFDVERISRDIIMQKGGAVADRTVTMLEQERIKNQFLVAMSDEFFFEYDLETDTLDLSKKGAELMNVDAMIFDFIKSGKQLEFFSITDIEDFFSKIKELNLDRPLFQTQYMMKLPDGSQRWHEFTVRPRWCRDGEPTLVGCIGKVIDVHDRRTESGRMQEVAEKDALTDLYNQLTARKLIEESIKKTPDQFAAIILIDVDNFKQINDQRGYTFGDRILKYIASSVKKSTRWGDIVARVGADKFIIFIKEVKEEDIQAQVQRIFKVVVQENDASYCSVSMGAAGYPKDGVTYAELLSKAEEALRLSKESGKNQWRLYGDGLKQSIENDNL